MVRVTARNEAACVSTNGFNDVTQIACATAKAIATRGRSSQ